ncbi:MAG: HEAT repeat domain-containing protein [Anaerolineae bacterium]|nr:HEAT repeat domain-containing protein [Anaerolineae bacterium]
MQIFQKSARFFDRLFNIRPGEWPLVSLLFLIATLSSVGFVWGTTITYAGFLSEKNGLETLPWIISLVAILSIVASAAYAPFVDRLADDKLHNLIFVIEVGGIILGLLMLRLNLPAVAYPFLYLLGFATIAVINPHQTTYFNNFFNTQTAKRTLPIINAGYRVGGIVAGLIMPALNRLFSNNPQGIIGAWLLTHLAMMAVVWLLPYILQGRQAGAKTPVGAGSLQQQPSYLDNVKEGFRYTTQSTFLLWMAISTLLLMALLALLEYRSTELLLREYDNAAEFAAFLAGLSAIANFFVVPILLFGLSRIIGFLGLGNASLIFPVGNLAVCAGLIVRPGWFTAAAAYVNRGDFQLAFQYPIEGLLYNAVSARVKGRVRAFINGLLSPAGSLLGGLLLLLFIIFMPTLAWLIIVLIGVLAVAYLGGTLIVRKFYSQALLKMLEQENYSFLLLQRGSEFSVADPTTLKLLQQRLAESDDPQFTIFMANLIGQIGGSEATKILVNAARTATDPETQAGIIDVIVAADIGGNEVRQLYTDLLADPNGRLKQAALLGLEGLFGLESPQFLNMALPMLADPDLEVQTQILSSLTRAENFYAFPAAGQTLAQLLANENPHRRARGVLIQGRVAYVQTSRSLSGVTKSVFNLTPHLSDPADEVRLQAMLAVEKVSENQLTEQLADIVIQQINPLVKDPVERIRQATLVVYSRLAKREAHPILVNALNDASSQVRLAAIEMMVQVGKSVIPVIHPLLDSPDPNLRKTAAVILTRIDKNEHGALILPHLTGNLLAIYRQHGYLAALAPFAHHTSIVVLQSTLREQNRHLLAEIFYLLSALHGGDAIKIITESLRSEDALMRANAIEALESLTTPQTARLISPLYDPDIEPAYMLDLSAETWEMDPPTATQVIELFTQTNDSWLRAIMVFALGEMAGAMMQPEAVDEAATPPTGPPAQRLTDLVGGVSTQDQTTAEKPKARRRRPPDILDLLGDKTEAESQSQRSRRKRMPDVFAALTGETAKTEAQPVETSGPPVSAPGGVGPKLPPLEIEKINHIIETALTDPEADVRMAARSAKRMMTGLDVAEVHLAAIMVNRLVKDAQREVVVNEEEFMLSTIEKVIFLKKVPFFQGMTIDQLRTLANVCEEELFEQGTPIFNEGETGGTLYVVVSGKVAIEKEGKRKGSFARLSTIDAHSYFGEMNLFDNSPYASSAIALQDTLTLRLRREPLIALARQYPDMSLELINVLSQRLREMNDQVVELTRAKPRELHKLFDKFDQ